MSTVLLIIQLIISVALTGLILIQRSEGGALGIGGGGGGGLMSGRSAATSIVRVTAILGALFIINCLLLSIVFKMENKDQTASDQPKAAVESVQESELPTEVEIAPMDIKPEIEAENIADEAGEASVPEGENADIKAPKPLDAP